MGLFAGGDDRIAEDGRVGSVGDGAISLVRIGNVPVMHSQGGAQVACRREAENGQAGRIAAERGCPGAHQPDRPGNILQGLQPDRGEA